MITKTDEYRARLLIEVEKLQEEERNQALYEKYSQMSDRELEDEVCNELGLPIGTTFTDRQIAWIAGEKYTPPITINTRLPMDGPK